MPLIRSIKPKRFAHDDDGSTIIEFAFIAPVLMLLMMGVVELGLVMGGQAVLDNASFIASRTGKTGYADGDKSQAKTIAAAVQAAASSYLDPSKITITSVAYSDYDSIGPEPFTDTNKNGVWDAGEPYTDVNKNGSYDANPGTKGYGGAGQIVVYTVSYDWQLQTPLIKHFLGSNGVVPLKTRIVVKNEPYS
ncbi:MAG: hypothetical protein DI565_03595 [Ancylobacter novellus]|uniref:TadE-like domain-containing protein n=1 Tax=Ancylobacter novellus TaxID=921 RepID=A0A2W5KP62_ANCNO|nr:MAG: hypothetical protein DI565_03595 [Ancylobacter novellus]